MSKITEKENTIKDYLGITAIFGVIILLCGWSWISLHDSENQFNYVKEKIENMDFECIEGFDGVEYGYTGEIGYRHGFFDSGLGVVGFQNNLTDEQAKILTEMFLSKLSTLPCYDEYVELGNSMLLSESRN